MTVSNVFETLRDSLLLLGYHRFFNEHYTEMLLVNNPFYFDGTIRSEQLRPNLYVLSTHWFYMAWLKEIQFLQNNKNNHNNNILSRFLSFQNAQESSVDDIALQAYERILSLSLPVSLSLRLDIEIVDEKVLAIELHTLASTLALMTLSFENKTNKDNSWNISYSYDATGSDSNESFELDTWKVDRVKQADSYLKSSIHCYPMDNSRNHFTDMRVEHTVSAEEVDQVYEIEMLESTSRVSKNHSSLVTHHPSLSICGQPCDGMCDTPDVMNDDESIHSVLRWLLDNTAQRRDTVADAIEDFEFLERTDQSLVLLQEAVASVTKDVREMNVEIQVLRTAQKAAINT